jgi:pimeloyl-ACP methyl ester carboxylesterase
MKLASRALDAPAPADHTGTSWDGAKTRDHRLRISGSSIAFTTAGCGPPLLLIHGLGGTRQTWSHVIESLAATHTVIAPDLPGHGDSEAPAGDYSLGAHAVAVRDLLIALGHPSASIIGHSLGGGIALQFAYHFPERTHRLLLISSGGLGPELTLMLRASTLPGANRVVAGMARLPTGVTRRALAALSRVPGVLARQDAEPLSRGMHDLSGDRQRQAFIHTARAVIDWRGQKVSATRQLGLLAGMPMMVAWGSDDRTIPSHHHRAVAGQVPDAQIVEIPRAGHYPHETAAGQLLPHIHDFLASTEPFRYSETRWRNGLNTPGAPCSPAT